MTDFQEKVVLVRTYDEVLRAIDEAERCIASERSRLQANTDTLEILLRQKKELEELIK